MRLLAFGTYDASAHPRVAVLIQGLRAAGDEVAECNVPLGLDTATRVALLRSPWRLPQLGARLLSAWLPLVRRTRRLPAPDALVVGYLGHFDVHLARWLFRTTPLALDHLVGATDTATDRGSSGRVKDRLLTRIDTAALAAADAVIVDTEEHRDQLSPAVRAKAVVVPVGAPAEWNFPPVARPSEAPMRVIFFGLYTPLQGAETIGRAVGELAGSDDLEILMVGHGQDLPAARRAARSNPRVRWLDWVAPPDLPPLVAGHDVCLGIFGTTPKAQRVVPNKVYQGAAAGCAVVTSDTPPQRRVLGDAALFVPPGDSTALADVLRGLAADRERLLALRRSASAFSATFAPVAVVAPLRERLATLVATREPEQP